MALGPRPVGASLQRPGAYRAGRFNASLPSAVFKTVAARPAQTWKSNLGIRSHRGRGFAPLPWAEQHRTARAPALASAAPSGESPGERKPAEKKVTIGQLRDGLVEIFTTTTTLLLEALSVIRQSFLTLFIVHELAALCQFFIQRLSHRVLNEGALRFLSLPEGAIPSMWFASDIPEIMNFETGYQQLSYIAFLLVVPLSSLIRSIAATATIALFDIVRRRNEEKAKHDELAASAMNATEGSSSESTALKAKEDKVGWFGKLKAAVGTLWSLRRRIGAMWLQMWVVELLVTVRVLPLEVMSYIVFTLPFTLPRILNLQLSMPAALKENLKGNAAIKRSTELVKGIRWPLLVLLIGTLTCARTLEAAQTIFLTRLPARIYTDIPEIPLIVSILAYLGNRVINRVRDVIPVVAYEFKTNKEAKGDAKEEEIGDEGNSEKPEPGTSGGETSPKEADAKTDVQAGNTKYAQGEAKGLETTSKEAGGEAKDQENAGSEAEGKAKEIDCRGKEAGGNAVEQEIPAKDADGKGVPQESAGKEVGGDAEEEAAVKEKGGSQSPEESGAKKA